jgi:ribosomal-protein-alanine N-acetyltransferase
VTRHPPTLTFRRATLDDLAAWADFEDRNEPFFRPFQPTPSPHTTTEQRVRLRIDSMHQGGRVVNATWLASAAGELVARVSISNIVRGAFQSAHLGYGVDAEWNGRGIATAAVAHVVQQAFGELQLHWIEAGTLVDNTASKRVLEKNGFAQYGMSPRHLRIAGAWRDHALYTLTAEDYAV